MLFESLAVTAALVAVLFAFAYGIAKVAAAFSSFDPATVRLATEFDDLGCPVKWETNKEYRARMLMPLPNAFYAGDL